MWTILISVRDLRWHGFIEALLRSFIFNINFVVIRGVKLVEASTNNTGLSLLTLRSMPSNLEEL